MCEIDINGKDIMTHGIDRMFRVFLYKENFLVQALSS